MRVAHAFAAAACAAGLLAGCGEKDEPVGTRARAVTGTIELERPAAGAPDAGTEGGHRAPDATASTRAASFAFEGRVVPKTSRVTLRRAPGGPSPVEVGPDGRFRAQARGLRPGANRYVLEGRARGLAAWTAEISITRR